MPEELTYAVADGVATTGPVAPGAATRGMSATHERG
jgi:hypothetical protein